MYRKQLKDVQKTGKVLCENLLRLPVAFYLWICYDCTQNVQTDRKT